LRESFNSEFFEDMFPKIHKFIRARFSSDLAEDLASETFVTLLRKELPPPTDEVGLRQRRTLTYKIALGLISNAVRQNTRDRAHAGPPSLLIHDGQDPTFEAVVPLVVAEAIATLDFNDRQALNLLIAGFGTNEIADILGISPRAASMRLVRARERLSGRLTNRREETDGADA